MENPKLNVADASNPVASHRFAMRQLENALYEHTEIEEVAVFFVPDENGKEKLVAFIVPKNQELNAAEIMNFLTQSSQLPPDNLPEAIKFIPRIPKSPSGKVLKLRLLEDICPKF